MKKIIIQVNSLNRGGAEHVSVNLAEYMVQHGIECTLLTEKIGENEYTISDKVNRISLNINGGKYLNYFFNVYRMRKEIKKIDADTILIMDTPSCLLAIPAVLGLKMKVVVSERNDPNHIPGKPIVTKIARLFMRFANGFVFQTSDAKQFYKKALKGRGIIIPNPLFSDNIPKPYNGKKKNVIISAGRLTQQKNQKLLISAFKEIHDKYPEFSLVIFGEGGLRETLQEYIEQLKLSDSVFLPGNKIDYLERIKDAFLFVLTSDYEGMPNVLIEAMAMGLTCISSDCPCGGPRALIKHNENGLLFPVGDREALISNIMYCIENQNIAHKMGENAVEVREKLDSDTICKQWVEYLSSNL